MVMQNMYIVYGNPSWSSKFLISCFNTCGRFSSIKYEFFGTPGQDDYGCRAWATEYATGERVQGIDVTIGMAKAENWMSKKGSKWQTMPQLMLQYRAATFLIRTVAPELKPAQGFVAQAAAIKSEAAAIAERAQTIDMPATAAEVQPAQEPAPVMQQAPQAKRGPAWATND